MHLSKRLAACIDDPRQEGKVLHSIHDLLRQRIYGIACGYADCNNAARLANDPIQKLLLDRDPIEGDALGSQPTLCRFENAPSQKELYKLGIELAEIVVSHHAERLKGKARRITIDLDPTDDPTHGRQQLSFFNGISPHAQISAQKVQRILAFVPNKQSDVVSLEEVPEIGLHFTSARTVVIMIEAILEDARRALHDLRRAPGFSMVIVLTLALGIGANTALYSLLNAVVLRPLPVRDADRLAAVSLADRQNVLQVMYYETFLELRRHQHVFETLFAYMGGGLFATEYNGAVAGAGIEGSTPEYYSTFGIRPLLGRFVSEEDMPAGGEPARVVVLGYRFWQRLFGGDRNVIGRALNVDGTPLAIIGVMPPEFRGLQVDVGSDIFVPLTLIPRLGASPAGMKRPNRLMYAIGRLREGVVLEQARAEMSTILPSILAQTAPSSLSPAERENIRSQQVKVASVAGGISQLRDRYTDPLLVLIGLAALLLVIACVNLSSLLLARALDREQRLAICLALGATRARLVQQTILESLLLSFAGTVCALPLAWWGSTALSTMMWTGTVPLLTSVTPDARVLGVMAAIMVGTGLVVSVLPAWAATASRSPALLQPTRTVARASNRWGKILLVAQVALSVVLVFCAGLFARSLSNLHALDSGFTDDTAKAILWTRLNSQPGGYLKINDASYYPELLRQLSALPGVNSVALAHFFPTYFNFTLAQQTIARAEPAGKADEATGRMEILSPGFFETVGIPLLQGRDFTWNDAAANPAVAIINEALRRKFFPSSDPIGQRIRIGTDPRRRAVEIIGIVRDVTVSNLRTPHVPVVFRPMLQEPQLSHVPVVNLRASGDPRALSDPVRRVVASLGHEYVPNIFTLAEQVDRSLVQERVLTVLSSFFAGLAAFLAFVGLFALLAHAVVRRTREIGIRMALGASRAQVVRMVMWQGVGLILLGIVAGIPCAFGAGRLTGTLLFGLAPSDPVTLACAAGCLIVVGTAAGLIPSRRASRIEPLTALRCE